MMKSIFNKLRGVQEYTKKFTPGIPIKENYCPECNRQFASSKGLNIHTTKTHAKKKKPQDA